MKAVRANSMGRTDYLSLRQGPVNGSRIRTAGLLASIAALLVLAPAGRASAPAQTALQPALPARLSKALAVPNVNHARSAALAVDLTTRQIVFARHPHLSLAPASTEKLALSYALLTELGPTYRIETSVVGSGELVGSTWRGDLVLRGRGDPTLRTAGLRRLVVQVRRRGIRRITGSIVGDESFFDARRTAPGWKSWYYIGESAPLSALTVDRARYGGRVSHQPALAAAALFRSALVSSGIAVSGAAKVGRLEGEVALATVASPPLLRLLRTVNRESDNFTAEILLKHLGAIQAGRGSTAAGAAIVRRVLAAAGVSLEGTRFVDGSGLSLLNRVTADSLVRILFAAWEDPLLRGSFLASLAVAGENGTLERRLTRAPAQGRVFAKTGTTSLATALAGYAGARFAFAIVHNGPPLSIWWSRHAQDRFVMVLAAQ